MRHIAWTLVLAAALGCSKKEPAEGTGQAGQPAAAPVASVAATEAKHLYATVCANCHGESGRGDGRTGLQLNPRPRDYTDKAWQATVSDAEIRKTILEGGLAVGKSPIMPAQPQLADKPDVLDEVVKLVRSFAR